jgi:hypothetical protein
MKKITILLLFVMPLFSLAQEPGDWLTPFADVRFENNKIVYSFCNSEQLMMLGVIPKYYSQSLMKLKTEFNRPTPDIADVGKQQQKIREYLKETKTISLSAKDQEEYLRLSAMVLIWDLELDRQVLTELDILKRSETPEIKKNSELVLQLEDVYKALR